MGFLQDNLGSGLDSLFKKNKKAYIRDWSPKGKELKGKLTTSIMDAPFPENLATIILGQHKQAFQAMARETDKKIAGAGYRGPETAGSGAATQGFLRENATRLGNVQSGAKAVGGAKREVALNRLNDLQSLIKLDADMPAAQARAQASFDALEQAEGVEKGAMIGSLAQMAALASDIRIKENIATIDSPLEKLKKLTGYTYNYIDSPPESRNGGVMAQDLEQVLPDAVTEIDGVKFVRYDAVIALLVNAVNELREKIGA